jgi:hypothetical protein
VCPEGRRREVKAINQASHGGGEKLRQKAKEGAKAEPPRTMVKDLELEAGPLELQQGRRAVRASLGPMAGDARATSIRGGS